MVDSALRGTLYSGTRSQFTAHRPDDAGGKARHIGAKNKECYSRLAVSAMLKMNTQYGVIMILQRIRSLESREQRDQVKERVSWKFQGLGFQGSLETDEVSKQL